MSERLFRCTRGSEGECAKETMKGGSEVDLLLPRGFEVRAKEQGMTHRELENKTEGAKQSSRRWTARVQSRSQTNQGREQGACRSAKGSESEGERVNACMNEGLNE